MVTDKDIFDVLLHKESTDEVLDAEQITADEYNSRFVKIKIACNKLVRTEVNEIGSKATRTKSMKV